MQYEALIALVLSSSPGTVSRELADLLVAGAAPGPEPAAPLFSRPLVAGELECLISVALDAESIGVVQSERVAA